MRVSYFKEDLEIMTEVEKRISLEKVDVATLLGPGDQHIKMLEEKFTGAIIVRGEVAIIRGISDEVTAIERAFKEMLYVLNTTNQLRATDVQLILDLGSYANSTSKPEHDHDSIILYTKDDAIRLRTLGQQHYVQTVQKNDICFAIGPAGTGKTYIAVAMAVSALKKGLVKKIVLARPAVEAGESLGYLPGDFKEKIDPYLRPLYDSLEDMIPSEKLRGFIEKGIIEIVPLAYMRGRTLNNAFVILDEAQNSTDLQMKMFLTRLGANSRCIITGDITQIDLPQKQVSGLVKAQEILKEVSGIGFVYFDKSDVIRHKLVKDIIDAYEKQYGK